jgi:hypothetical protein
MREHEVVSAEMTNQAVAGRQVDAQPPFGAGHQVCHGSSPIVVESRQARI